MGHDPCDDGTYHRGLKNSPIVCASYSKTSKPRRCHANPILTVPSIDASHGLPFWAESQGIPWLWTA